MTAQPYTFRLDDAEVARFNEMAANAKRHEHELWQQAGIDDGKTVVDLGCGPGALLPLLAARVGARGCLIAVDADADACARVREVASALDASVHVVQADIARTGLPSASADVVLMRNVLVHNGRRASELLEHAARLLRPGGCLLSAEPDVAGIDFGTALAEQEYDNRWATMMRHDGNDPELGRGDRLSQLLQRNGWSVLATITWTDRLEIDKSPAWAAAEQITSRGFATTREVASWRQAMAVRRAQGPLQCSLAMTTVLSRPGRLTD